MMNLNKRSASPSQEELDQLTAMHLLKRQRLAQAAAAAEALFRPSLMDMQGIHNGGHPHAPLFHPGAARLRLTNAFQQSPYYPSPALWGAAGPVPSMDMNMNMPLLPSMPNMNMPNNVVGAPGGSMGLSGGGAIPERAGSPPQAQAQGQGQGQLQDGDKTGAGLEQLSAFASHMPTMPVPLNSVRRKSSVDAPASGFNTNTSPKRANEEAKTDDLLCAPVSSSSGPSTSPAPVLTLPLKTMKMAKKLATPVMDNNAKALHWEDRPYAPLAINEDSNWLSEFQVRKSKLLLRFSSPHCII